MLRFIVTAVILTILFQPGPLQQRSYVVDRICNGYAVLETLEPETDKLLVPRGAFGQFSESDNVWVTRSEAGLIFRIRKQDEQTQVRVEIIENLLDQIKSPGMVH